MAAMWPRRSSAMRKKKLTTSSSCPANLARSSSSCVAIPTGQVFLWHLRIMMHPIVISGAVERPPLLGAQQGHDEVALHLELPVRLKHGAAAGRSLATSVCCVSARPELPGEPRALDAGPSRPWCRRRGRR